jgi:hypothetical protein
MMFQMMKSQFNDSQITDAVNHIEQAKHRHNTSGGVFAVEFKKLQSQRLGSV